MGVGHFSNNVTIKNENQFLLIQSATAGSGATTSTDVGANNDSGSEWTLNGAIWITGGGGAAAKFLQFSHDGGTNWFDIDSRVPNITNQGATAATEVNFLFNNFPICNGARFRVRKATGTDSATVSVWAWATRKQNTP